MNRLLVLLALGLKLPRNFFLDKYEDPLETLRLLRYAPEVSNPGQGKFGAGKTSLTSVQVWSFHIPILVFQSISGSVDWCSFDEQWLLSDLSCDFPAQKEMKN